MKALTHTDYQFPDQVSVYHGKVRDVYDIAGRTLVMSLPTASQPSTSSCPKASPTKDKS